MNETYRTDKKWNEPHAAEKVASELLNCGGRLQWVVLYKYNGKHFRCLKSTWERDYQKVEGNQR